ncbi:hypothetical protein TSAR_000126 [Trichomalopsis sarcophagae]|uniref:Uncharacterized protein n=1 Tax=Trichomalopsis sarcophagae TaxID=543379 RepID=A0A232F5L3_9HYME|nr:hypothetical protein TSAR_000126 [Trichomalopsis sarcophagae]
MDYPVTAFTGKIDQTPKQYEFPKPANETIVDKSKPQITSMFDNNAEGACALPGISAIQYELENINERMSNLNPNATSKSTNTISRMSMPLAARERLSINEKCMVGVKNYFDISKLSTSANPVENNPLPNLKRAQHKETRRSKDHFRTAINIEKREAMQLSNE